MKRVIAYFVSGMRTGSFFYLCLVLLSHLYTNIVYPAVNALNITEQLFAGNIKNLSVKELKQGLRGVPNYQVQAEDNLNIVELLVTAGVVNSKRQAREDVQNGAIYVNGERIQDLDYVLSDSDKLENELTVIRRGKKKYFVLTY